MATKPLTSEAIALTEKKMDMTLDAIIKMSKTRDTKPKKQRVSNKGQKFINRVSQVNKSLKVQSFMDTRSSLRQGALAQRRSNFQENQFPLATEAAKRAAIAPVRNRAFNRPRQFNVNTRIGAPAVQKNVATGSGFKVKKPVQQGNVGPNQRTQTLDSRFANMKEERKRLMSQQNNGSRRNGLPWAGGHQRN